MGVCFPTLHKSEEPSPLPRGAHYRGTWSQMPHITRPVTAMFFHPKRQGHLTTPNPHVCPPTVRGPHKLSSQSALPRALHVAESAPLRGDYRRGLQGNGRRGLRGEQRMGSAAGTTDGVSRGTVDRVCGGMAEPWNG